MEQCFSSFVREELMHIRRKGEHMKRTLGNIFIAFQRLNKEIEEKRAATAETTKMNRLKRQRRT